MAFTNPIDISNLGIFVTESGSTIYPKAAYNIHGLTNLQSIDRNVDIPTEAIQVGGRSAATIAYTESPDITIDFSYLSVDLYNEFRLGFTIDSQNSCVSTILTRETDEKDYFVAVSDAGVDLRNLSPADYGVFAYGNGFISSWSTEGSVGGFATTTVSVACSNLCFTADGVDEQVATIEPSTGLRHTGHFTLPVGVSTLTGQPLLINQGDIVLEVTENPTNALFHNPTGMAIQSYNISFDLNRNEIDQLGNKYATSRKVVFPVEVNMSIDAFAADITTGCLDDIICNDETNNVSLAVSLYKPNCSGIRGDIFARYELKDARFNGFSDSVTAGSDQTVTLNYIATISASGDNKGLFFSGCYNYGAGGTPVFSS